MDAMGFWILDQVEVLYYRLKANSNTQTKLDEVQYRSKAKLKLGLRGKTPLLSSWCWCSEGIVLLIIISPAHRWILSGVTSYYHTLLSKYLAITCHCHGHCTAMHAVDVAARRSRRVLSALELECSIQSITITVAY